MRVRFCQIFAIFSLFAGLCSCDTTESSPIQGADAGDAHADASVDSAAIDPGDDGCISYARPTGTCTFPGTCCVSSACVDGICR